MKCETCVYDSPFDDQLYLRKYDNKKYCSQCASNMVGWDRVKVPKNKKQYVGIELELMPVNLDKPKPIWHKKSDGSLNVGGIELVLEKPLTVLTAKTEVKRLARLLKFGKSYTDNHCGYHLHLDCTSLSHEQVFYFLKFAYRIQESAFSLVKKERGNCCFSMKFNSSVEQPLVQATKDLAGLQALLYYKRNITNSRYYWFNMASYFKRQTIEIRHHHGSVCEKEINNWVELWTKLLQFITTVNPVIDNQDILYWAQRAGVKDSTIDFYYKQREKFSE